MWLSTLEIGPAQLRSVTETAPKSPFLCVKKKSYPVWFSCRRKSFPALITQPQSLALSLFIESGNVNLRSGPVSTILQNLLEILLACDTDEVDVLTQVSMGCKTT